MVGKNGIKWAAGWGFLSNGFVFEMVRRLMLKYQLRKSPARVEAFIGGFGFSVD